MSDTTLNRFFGQGTAAEMAAFTPDPPTPASGPDQAYYFYDTDNDELNWWDGAAWQPVTTGGGTIVGSTGATDNALIRADGTGGSTIQAGGLITLSDAGALTFPDDVRQTFNPGSNAAGLNVGSIAGDPGTPSNGDLWYDSTANELTARINGANVALGAGGGATVAQAARIAIYPLFTPSGDDDEFDNESFSGWTAVNGGSNNPTITELNDCASFVLPGGDSGLAQHAYMKARTVSANDWIEACVRGTGKAQNYPMFGVIFADGNTYGAGNQVGTFIAIAESLWYSISLTNYQSLNANSNYGMQANTTRGDYFIRIKYEGSNNWSSWISPDGISWTNISGTLSRTMTPTHAGFTMTSFGSTTPFIWSVRYIRFGNG